MRRTFALAVLLASGLTLNATAQTKPATVAHVGVPKIAVIAFQAAVTQTNEFRRNFADLQRKYEPKRHELKSMSDEVNTLTNQLKAQSATLSDAERANRSRVIDEKKRDIQRTAQDDQTDYQQDLQDTFNGVATKVAAVMSDYAKKHGYDLVLDISEQQTPVVYASSTINITKEIVDAYNLKSGIPAPPAEAPAAPTPKPAGTN